MFADSDSDFLPSRISDKARTKNIQKFVLSFWADINFRKLKIINYILESLLTKNLSILTQKLLLISQKYGCGIRDLRSGIRKKTHPGPRIHETKKHWIPDPDPQH